MLYCDDEQKAICIIFVRMRFSFWESLTKLFISIFNKILLIWLWSIEVFFSSVVLFIIACHFISITLNSTQKYDVCSGLFTLSFNQEFDCEIFWWNCIFDENSCVAIINNLKLSVELSSPRENSRARCHWIECENQCFAMWSTSYGEFYIVWKMCKSHMWSFLLEKYWFVQRPRRIFREIILWTKFVQFHNSIGGKLKFMNVTVAT